MIHKLILTTTTKPYNKYDNRIMIVTTTAKGAQVFTLAPKLKKKKLVSRMA